MTRAKAWLTEHLEPIFAVILTLFLAFRCSDDALWLAHTASPEAVRAGYCLLLGLAVVLEAAALVRFRNTGRPYSLLTAIPLAAYLYAASASMLFPPITLGYFALILVVRSAMLLRVRRNGPEEQRGSAASMLVEVVLALCLLFSRFVTFADAFAAG